MPMEDANKMLEEQQHELERIRGKKWNYVDLEKLRKLLNIAFLALALIGLVLYYCYPNNRVWGLTVLAVGMILKVFEFFIRFMF